MIRNIRVMDVELPDEVLSFFRGPRYGLVGVRQLLGVFNRSMLCATIKPMGLSIDAMAEIAYQTALGGVDFVKDDHGLTDQAFANYKVRVTRCARAVLEANSEAGNHCLYTPNITAPIDQMLDRAFFAKEAGAGAFMIIPALVGWDAVRMISENAELGLPIISHPSYGGIYSISTQGGIAAKFQYGMLPRLAGSDVAIFPNFVGRLYSTKQECVDVMGAAKEKLGNIKPLIPAPGGGVTLKTVAEMNEFYGRDVVYIMGGGLHRGGTLVDNCKKFIGLVSKN
jgi:ribulose-bisphosphate carboxylase large chain